MKCKGKTDIIIRQPFGTVIDERAQLHSLHGTSGTLDGHLSDDLLSVGLVVVQKPKLLILPSNSHDDISQLYSMPVLEAFSTKNYLNGERKSSLKKRSWRNEGLEDVGTQPKKQKPYY